MDGTNRNRIKKTTKCVPVVLFWFFDEELFYLFDGHEKFTLITGILLFSASVMWSA
jgi:hypothetical protein